jgi:ribosomal protein S18 acetylase RimI-like enzyme
VPHSFKGSVRVNGVELTVQNSSDLPRIRIREMTIDDIPTVFAIGNSVFTKDKYVFLYRTWETYEVTGLFSTDPELCLVAEVEGEVVGFALGSIIEKPKSSWTYGYLIWTGVVPRFQRYKIGRRLYLEMEKRVMKLGARMMIIDTEGTNITAVRFFESLGFSKGSQHLWMTKRLVKSRATGKTRKTREDV